MEIVEIGINDGVYGQYDGSRRFEWLADLCGLSVDLVSTKDYIISTSSL